MIEPWNFLTIASLSQHESGEGRAPAGPALSHHLGSSLL